MDIPITNPHLSANLEDNSKVDDSFTQSGTTVNIGAGATYNQNCGNQKELSRRAAMWRGIVFSVVCDAIIVWAIFTGQERMADRFEDIEQKAAETHQVMMKQAKEGTIWLLRDDIIKTLDYHEVKKTITQKQYKRVKDEYDYYTSIGGNHDVKDRFDNFYYKIFGTGEIKMVASDEKNQNR